MKQILITAVLIALIFSSTAFSQDNDVILGKEKTQTSGAFYDLSDPMGINIDVNLWGFVKLPGKYRVPYKSTFMDLMSYCGGPSENTNLKEIRIFRPGNDSLKTKSEIIKLNYEDLLWGDINTKNFNNPVLKSGDLILVMEDKRYTFRDNLLIILPVISSVLTIATLIITLTNK